LQWRGTAHRAAVSASVRHSVRGGTKFPTMQPSEERCERWRTAHLHWHGTTAAGETAHSCNRRAGTNLPTIHAFYGKQEFSGNAPLSRGVVRAAADMTDLRSVRSGTNLPTMRPCTGECPHWWTAPAQSTLTGATAGCRTGSSTKFPTFQAHLGYRVTSLYAATWRSSPLARSTGTASTNFPTMLLSSAQWLATI
jgi:hypothetical protein